MEAPVLLYDPVETARYRRNHKIILATFIGIVAINTGLTVITVPRYGCLDHKVACPMTAISLLVGALVILTGVMRMIKIRYAFRKPWYCKSFVIAMMLYIVVEVLRIALMFPAYYQFSKVDGAIFITQTVFCLIGALLILFSIVVTIIAVVYERNRRT